MQPDTRIFQILPLSPIHIGSGQRLSPEDYFFDRDALLRIDTPRLLASLNPAARHQFETLLDQGDLSKTREFLRNAFAAFPRRNALIRYRIPLGPSSLDDLRSLTAHPERRGDIHVLPRNPYSGDIVIPGSAIKGALRTALLNRFLQEVPSAQNHLASLPVRERSRDLAARIFEAPSHATERDPARLLKVSDASWPQSFIRVDKTHLRKLGRDDSQTAGIQAHFERLLSQADQTLPNPLPTLTISLQIPSPLHKTTITRPFDWPNLIYAANNFFSERLQAECDRFPFLGSAYHHWNLPPSFRPGADLLLRVGRFCHFDSLSLNHLRQSENRQTRQPIYNIGSTRTLCPIRPNLAAPFGWLVLRQLP